MVTLMNDQKIDPLIFHKEFLESVIYMHYKGHWNILNHLHLPHLPHPFINYKEITLQLGHLYYYSMQSVQSWHAMCARKCMQHGQTQKSLFFKVHTLSKSDILV